MTRKLFLNTAYNHLRTHLPESFLRNTPLFYNFEPQQEEISEKRFSDLNSIFEELYWKGTEGAKASNRHGVVFTPQSLQKLLVRELQLKDYEFSSLRIIDPASGGGVLLGEILRSGISTRKINSAKKGIEFIKRSLYGVDRNPVAIEVTKFTLLLILAEYFPDEKEKITDSFSDIHTNFVTGNTLLSKGFRHDALSIKTLFSEIIEDGGFSHVIGNPPYGLSRDDQISSHELTILKKRYREYLSGKPNKYMIFMIRSYELLKPGGIFSLLVPNSWLGIRSATNLRRFFLQSGSLRKVMSFSKKEFKGRGVEVVIATGEKRFQSSFQSFSFTDSNDDTPLKSVEHKTEVILRDKGGEIPVGWGADTANLWNTISSNSIPLSESGLPLTPKIALQVYRTGGGSPPQTKDVVREHPFHSTSKETDEHIPYLEGRDIKRYNINWSGKYLHYGPWIAEHQPRELYNGPRIIIREILGKGTNLFQATYSEEEFVYNRSVLHIIPHSSHDKKILLALLLLLNSSVGSFYLLAKGRKCQRGLFPKIVNDDLKGFPIPHNFLAMADKLANLALEELTFTKKRNSSVIASEAKQSQLRKIIKQEISVLYGLNEDFNLIKNELTPSF